VNPGPALEALLDWIQAGSRVLVVTSWDEERIDGLAREAASRLGRPVAYWSSVRGLDVGSGGPAAALTRDVGSLFAQLRRSGQVAIVAHDLGESLDRPEQWRALLELDRDPEGPVLLATRRPGSPWPSTLDWVPDIRLDPLPAGAGVLAPDVPLQVRARLEKLDPDTREAWIQARIRATPGLVPVPHPRTFDQVGGLPRLKRWVQRRRPAFEPGSHLPWPRGLVFFGVQGTGKSLAAEAMGPALGLPVFRLEFARLYQRFVGETEARLGRLLEVLDQLGPSVIWIDEIDKALAGGADGAAADAGTAARVLGMFLTWLALRPAGQILVAVANDVDHLPTELLRAGRFDDWFFFDLPDETARQEILRLYLPDGVGPTEVRDVALLTEGYSGADLEQLTIEARFLAQERHETLHVSHLLAAAADVVPTARRWPERLERLRASGGGRAQRA
jgi:hypothetical protein